MFRLFRRRRAQAAPGPGMPPPPGRRRRRRPPRRSRWIYLFARIGVAAVVFLLIRYLIIPLLVLAA